MPLTRNHDFRGNTAKLGCRYPIGMRMNKLRYPPTPRPSNPDPKLSNLSRTFPQQSDNNVPCKADAECTHYLDLDNPVPRSHNKNAKLWRQLLQNFLINFSIFIERKVWYWFQPR